MPSPIIVEIVVSTSTAITSTSANEIKLTPFAEQAASKRALILTMLSEIPADISRGSRIYVQPFFAPKQLFPDGVADVVDLFTHANPLPKQQEVGRAIWHHRNVLLPYNLRDENVRLDQDDVRPLLEHLFPGPTSVAEFRHRSHILFQVDELPETPWPQTVGGLPITILDRHDRGRGLMFPKQNYANSDISICQEGYRVEDFSGETLRRLAADVDAEFRRVLPDVRVLELMFTCERTFYVVVEDHIDLAGMRPKLPGKIAKCWVGYLNDKELRRPSWAERPAKRMIEPQPIHGSGDNFDWTICHLNSPYTGHIQGNIVAKSARLEQSPPHPGDEPKYVLYDWAYMGQHEDNAGRVEPPDGACGSAVWDDNGTVSGFFEFYVAEGRWAGFAALVSASEVVEARYSLAKT